MSRRPVILITSALAGSMASQRDHIYSLRRNYADAVAELGGLPLILPYQRATIDEALNLCDGVVVSGSNPGEIVARDRLDYERALIAAAIARERPLLGICHGMQLIGQVLGGSIVSIDGLNTIKTDDELHFPYEVPDQLAHAIDITDGSRLKALLGVDRIMVNSFHRHELKGPGDFSVAARSPADGVSEVIESKTRALCLGLQWHPEFLVTQEDQVILKHFVDTCRK